MRDRVRERIECRALPGIADREQLVEVGRADVARLRGTEPEPIDGLPHRAGLPRLDTTGELVVGHANRGIQIEALGKRCAARQRHEGFEGTFLHAVGRVERREITGEPRAAATRLAFRLVLAVLGAQRNADRPRPGGEHIAAHGTRVDLLLDRLLHARSAGYVGKACLVLAVDVDAERIPRHTAVVRVDRQRRAAHDLIIGRIADCIDSQRVARCLHHASDVRDTRGFAVLRVRTPLPATAERAVGADHVAIGFAIDVVDDRRQIVVHAADAERLQAERSHLRLDRRRDERIARQDRRTVAGLERRPRSGVRAVVAPRRLHERVDVLGEVVRHARKCIAPPIRRFERTRAVVPDLRVAPVAALHPRVVGDRTVAELIWHAAFAEGDAAQRSGNDDAAVRRVAQRHFAAHEILRLTVGRRVGRIHQDSRAAVVPAAVAAAVARRHAVAIGDFAAQQHVAALLRETEAAGYGSFVRLVVAVIGRAGRELALEAGVVLVEDEVHHAGDGVRPIHRGRAAGDCLHALDELLRKIVDVDFAAVERRNGALPVEQRERSVAAHAAQIEHVETLRRGADARHRALRRLAVGEDRQ